MWPNIRQTGSDIRQSFGAMVGSMQNNVIEYMLYNRNAYDRFAGRLKQNRLPGAEYFSPFQPPFGPLASQGVETALGTVQRAATARGLAGVAGVARVAGRASMFSTAFYGGADAGAALQVYAETLYEEESRLRNAR